MAGQWFWAGETAGTNPCWAGETAGQWFWAGGDGDDESGHVPEQHPACFTGAIGNRNFRWSWRSQERTDAIGARNTRRRLHEEDAAYRRLTRQLPNRCGVVLRCPIHST